MQHSYGKKTYAALGKILLQKRPDIAEQLLVYCRVDGEKDLDKIPDFFKRFCEHLQIDPLQHTGKLYNQEKLKVRRLYIAAMLHIYNQSVFHQPHSMPLLRVKFVKQISNCLAVDISGISKMIRQVIFDQKTYEDFRNQVTQIVEHLNPQSDGKPKEGKH